MQYILMLTLCLVCAGAWAQSDSQLAPNADSPPAPIGGVRAEPVLPQKESWSINDLRLRDLTFYWDNDGTLPRIGQDTDRFYTNGAGIELSFDPNFTDQIREKLAPTGEWENPRFGLGLAIKQQIYTSSDITDPTPPIGDHPYSGYLYFAFSFQRADDKKRDHFELDLGVVGERSQGEMVQKFIHNAFPNQDDPQGWSTQSANEFAVNFTYQRTWKSRQAQIRGFEFEMLPALGFDLGNVSTRAKGRITLRAGHNLPEDFGPATLLGNKDHTVSANDWGEGDFSFYIYASMGMDVVARDIFLDGNTFATSRSVDSELLVAQASVGLVTRYKSLYLGWSQTYQTENFESQPSGQAWGSILLGYSYTF
jgi:lipid A 3-O-deacylase